VSGAAPTADPGRVVVVAAGFALWLGGKCVAAARWGDIRRLRAYRRSVAQSDALCLGVDLVDGSVLELREEAPGFDAFLDRCAAMLTGLLPYRDWHHRLDVASADGDGILLYDRTTRRY
jgi:hypothetical protein